MKTTFESLAITGASSGIGAALARAAAAPGVRLALSGRDESRLAAIAEECRKAGAEVTVARLDVRESDAVAAWIEREDTAKPLDLVIANAGISGGTAGGGEDWKQTAQIFATNLDGVVHTVLPAVEAMQARGRGQIAIMSSVASFRGFPTAPAYSGSKAAVRIWGEALRGNMARRGVGVSVICPGFVRSPMTDVNDFPMPFMMEAERAADIILRGLARNRGRIAFPWPTYFIGWLLAVLPTWLTDRLLARLPAKASTPQS